jgi:hypothetical protein
MPAKCSDWSSTWVMDNARQGRKLVLDESRTATGILSDITAPMITDVRGICIASKLANSAIMPSKSTLIRDKYYSGLSHGSRLKPSPDAGKDLL